MKFKSLGLAGLTLLTVVGCAPHDDSEPVLSQMELRQIQTKSFNSVDMKNVMKVMLSVLQDDGYIVKNANLDLGLISATKEMSVESRKEKTLSLMVNGEQARWKKNAQIEVSATVNSFGSDVKVRVNFQKKVIDNIGAPVSVDQVLDPEMYLDFFNKVSKGLFIEGEGL
ncbi:MAG: hypothetical protein K0S07_472 [Chlamydiales bacterium]|jgi:hypothetical protein|nr:hypothetical protein [Chlamydiales bacterium]